MLAELRCLHSHLAIYARKLPSDLLIFTKALQPWFRGAASIIYAIRQYREVQFVKLVANYHDNERRSHLSHS